MAFKPRGGQIDFDRIRTSLVNSKTSSTNNALFQTINSIIDYLSNFKSELSSITSPVFGDIIYRGRSSWEKLEAGRIGQSLRTFGSENSPRWTDVIKAIDFYFDNIAAGDMFDIFVEANCEIQYIVILADQVGDLELNIYRGQFINYPPTDSIVGSTPPIISGGDKLMDVSLTGWSRILNSGDALRVEVVSVSAIERIHGFIIVREF